MIILTPLGEDIAITAVTILLVIAVVYIINKALDEKYERKRKEACAPF